MIARVRKLTLTVHVISSVGWVGAVIVFLALSIIGVTHPDAVTVRGVYSAMEPAAWIVLVPLALASWLTGIVQSLVTSWGLFRHYWTIFKLLITTLVTAVLLIYMKTFTAMATAARDPGSDLEVVRSPSPVFHATLALLALLVTVVLGVYKPSGMTRHGRRCQRAMRSGSLDTVERTAGR